MADYPDWTDSVHIVGTDIMVAVDLQGAYIMMPVDIQAQYVTLDINIASVAGDVAINIGTVSGTVNVNLSAAAITLNVDIVAQTGGRIDVYVQGADLLYVNIWSQTVTLDINIAASAITLNVAIQSSAVTLNINLQSQSVNINIDIETQSVGVYSQPEWAAKGAADKTFNLCGTNKAVGAETQLDYTVPAGKRLLINQFAFYINANQAADADKDQVGLGYIQNLTDVTILSCIGGHGGGNTTYPKPIRIEAGKVVRFAAKNCTNHVCDQGVSAVGYEVTV